MLSLKRLGSLSFITFARYNTGLVKPMELDTLESVLSDVRAIIPIRPGLAQQTTDQAILLDKLRLEQDIHRRE